MRIFRHRRRVIVALAAALTLAGTALLAGVVGSQDSAASLPWRAGELAGNGEEREFEGYSQGVENGGAGGEAFEALTAARQWAEARTSPLGLVPPGSYGAAFDGLQALPNAPGTWTDVTRIPYDAEDVVYRDYFSNSSGGSGFVTGRVVGLAASGSTVYAAGANGGVWRSTQGGGNWAPIADQIPSLSSGALELAADGSLWYATGEANTGGTSYAGSGVYRLQSPGSGSFAVTDRVGGNELESTTINVVRFGGGKAWVATSRGIWYHDASTNAGGWTRSFAPNPGALADPTSTTAPYKNIVNDLLVDPGNPKHLIAAVGWRSGDAYNGFYETFDGGDNATDTWVKINPTGAINPKEIGNVSFAWSTDAKKLYAMNQSPSLLNKPVGTVNSYLDGIYVSNSGRIQGPWTKIAESHKLASSGSALKQSVIGKGYGPGIQAWYNQFLTVDPADANHVFAGLEEVFESWDGGANWRTVGPYWNFYFSCWHPDSEYPGPLQTGGTRCPLTTHPDQHAAAFGVVAGKPVIFVGNDGGVYRRPVGGTVDASGHGTDWVSLNDGTMDALQYYAVDIGAAVPGYTGGHSEVKTPAGTSGEPIISGGLQDNGGSILRIGGSKMSSNFGGDGGDVLVNPANGCEIVQEYVVLAMRVTRTCANPDSLDAFLDLSQSTTLDIAPPDVNARFIAPFAANGTDIDEWVAGGASLWFQDQGFAIESGSEWVPLRNFGSPVRVTTAVDFRGDTIVAAWCGPCNNAGFARGVTIGTRSGGTWTWSDVDTNVPVRYISGAALGADGTAYLAVNGFNRRFTEGPGSGIAGHVFKRSPGDAAWTNISGNLPDIPANSIELLGDGSIVVGTDLGVVISVDGGVTWKQLGDNFPATVAIDVELGPDGRVYAATHGRGIWRIGAPTGG